MSRLAENCRLQVVRPVLMQMGMHSPSAEEILMMIAAHESHFVHRVQEGGGPARGLWQMEPVEFHDIRDRYFPLRPHVRAAVRGVIPTAAELTMDMLVSDDRFACAMARVKLWKVPEPLPPPDDLEGMAVYSKKYWNSFLGKATPKKYIADYRRLVLDQPPVEA